jgi:hypothetical protein
MNNIILYKQFKSFCGKITYFYILLNKMFSLVLSYKNRSILNKEYPDIFLFIFTPL